MSITNDLKYEQIDYSKATPYSVELITKLLEEMLYAKVEQRTLKMWVPGKNKSRLKDKIRKMAGIDHKYLFIRRIRRESERHSRRNSMAKG